MGHGQAKIAHISKFKRSKGSLGGVEKFASHLKRVFPELEIFASDDAPPGDYGSELALAKALNQHLLDTGKIGRKTIVVCDGFWQAGLKGKVKATVNVAHGTYAGCAMANEFHRFGQTGLFLKLARWQEGAYRTADKIVAVSPLTAWELKRFYGLDSAVVVNGVDLDVFKPNGKGAKLLHVATPGRKQLEMVEAVAGVTRRPIEHLNIKTGKEQDEAAKWRQGSVFFQPSLYEGCSYASLEAMACGLVPVSYKTGIFWGLPDWAAVEVTDHHRQAYAEAIFEAMNGKNKFRPREWVETNASFDRFAAGWRDIIRGLR